MFQKLFRKISRTVHKPEPEKRILALGVDRIDLNRPKLCIVCNASLPPLVYTGRHDLDDGMGWFCYKGACCQRCGYPFSQYVHITDLEGPTKRDIWIGKSHQFFKDLGKDKVSEYLETIETVVEAVNLLFKEDKINAMLPPQSRMVSELNEETGIPPWMAYEMRKALAGHGSDLLVSIVESAKRIVATR